MAEPIFRTAAEAWAALLAELGDTIPDERLGLSIFYAGMSSALSIAYHYGTADLRAEIEAEFVENADG